MSAGVRRVLDSRRQQRRRKQSISQYYISVVFRGVSCVNHPHRRSVCTHVLTEQHVSHHTLLIRSTHECRAAERCTI